MSSALFSLSRSIRKARYKRRAKKANQFKNLRLRKYADRLNKNLPKSEVWFQAKWKKDMPEHSSEVFRDRYNCPSLRKYIPDVLNLGFWYIIEVDGEIHERPEQKFRDRLKNEYFREKGYQVFRVKAYDEESYQNTLKLVKERIERYHKQRSRLY